MNHKRNYIPIVEPGRKPRSEEKVLGTASAEGFLYDIVASSGGIPCDACWFRDTCDKKPKELPPCPKTQNGYGENLYFRRKYVDHGDPSKPPKTVKRTKRTQNTPTHDNHRKNTDQRPAETV